MPSGEDMDSAQDMSGNDTEQLTGEVGESLGLPEGAAGEIENASENNGSTNSGDPLYVQKRLKQQKRAHEREIRDLHARMADMQASMQNSHSNQEANPYNAGNSDVDEAIHKAVSFALKHKEMEEGKAKEMESRQHIAKQYQELNKHLDATADKYDDFDDVVRSDHVPFTPYMRDAALMLPKKGSGSAGEVLYHLAKSPEELARIARLHPVDQAAELVALSHALIGGSDQKSSSPRPLGQIKANPVVNSAGITEKTSPSAIRALMKAGKFK